ncbi:hypothetical protein FHR50_001134 [Xanthomonas arboricola]
MRIGRSASFSRLRGKVPAGRMGASEACRQSLPTMRDSRSLASRTIRCFSNGCPSALKIDISHWSISLTNAATVS